MPPTYTPKLRQIREKINPSFGAGLRITAADVKFLFEIIDEMREALEFAEGHLAEELSNVELHPIGHCPTLDMVRDALNKVRMANNTRAEHLKNMNSLPTQQYIAAVYGSEEDA